MAAALFLGGCSSMSSPPKKPSAEQLAEAFKKNMADADALVAQNNQEGAIRVYQKIAADNPTRQEPWGKIAQIHFSQGRYSLALVAAEEALQREPSDRKAKSIIAVGGVRLAVRSLEELRKDNSLSGDVNADARRLAFLLRQSLGQPVLPTDAKVRPQGRRMIRSKATVAPASAQPVHRDNSGNGGNPLDTFK
jgi:tetratricopeptide (TPR) repeat protein